MKNLYTSDKFLQLIRKIRISDLFFLLLLLYSIDNKVVAQPCMPTVPSFTVDLSAKADTTWISPSIARSDQCCGSTNPDKCIQFIITLHSNTAGIIFNIASGAIPTGAMYYQVGCATPTAVGSIICLTGVGPHTLTFCKPGNNTNTYSITAVPKPYASADIRIHDGCSGRISAFGYDTSTIVWTSIYPTPTGKYNNYLSCTSICSSVIVTPQPGFPSYVDYKVCGNAMNGCNASPTCDTVRVYFYPKLVSYTFPIVPIYCYLDSGLIVTAGPTGGLPPYKFSWSNGATTSKIFVGIGTYTLKVSDQTGCPPILDTVIVTIDTPYVDAGPNDTVCFDYTGSIGLKATGALFYNWQPDSTLSALNIPNPRVTPKKTTTYYVTGTSTVGEYIDNSDFSKGNSGFTSSYTYNSNLIPEGYYYVGNNPNATHPNWCVCGDHTTGTGNMMIINGATVAGVSVYNKTIDVIPYTSYAFSIWIQSVHPANPAKLQFMVNGVLLGSPFTILSTVGLWQNFFTIWYSGASTVATISIINQNTIANGNDFAIDDVSFGSVCPNTDSVTIYVSNISIQSKIQNNNCFHGQKGSIDLTVSGGIAPYKFSWSTGDTVEDPLNLKAGKYYVLITDKSGCSKSDSFIITEPGTQFKINNSIVNVDCYGNKNGSVNLTITGGKSPYNYKWSSGQATEDITNLAPGGYGVTVTDSFGCVNHDSVVIHQPSQLTISHTLTNVSCYGGNNGSINLTITGGTKPYNYKWSSGQTTEDINNLTAGGYGVMVTDSHGCTIKDTAIINQPSKLTISHTLTNVSCNGGNNGSINLTVNSGTKPYNYKWSSGQTTEDISNLTAGGYGVMVTDSHGCVIKDTAIISQPSKLTISHTLTNVSCNGGNNGSINLTVNSGTKPYNYKWSSGQTTEDINNLTAGGYGVMVTDSHGCTIKDTAIINQPSKLTISHTLTNVSCNGGNNGSINLTVNSGTKPYNYKWSSGQTTEDINNLIAGGYGVMVTDSHGCVIKDTAIINQPSKLTISHTLTNVSCNGGNNGSINLTVNGGTKPYNYKWSSGQTTEDINNLTAGGYGVMVTDSHGCTIKDTAIINQPSKLTISHILTNVSCNGGNNGSINLTVNSGTKPYSYKWSSGQTTEDINNLIAGGYGVMVTDSHGCTIKDTSIINQPSKLTISQTLTNVSCNGGNNGSINLTVNSGTKPYSYKWSSGQTTEDINNLISGNYYVTITDSHGCIIRDTAIINQPTKLTISHVIRNVSCNNGNNGSINITATGGTTPYNYKWNNGQITEDINNLVYGGYGVMVTDSHGCTIKDTAIINQPSKLTISHTLTNVSCNGDNNGSINLTVNGGIKSYSYKWSSGQTTEDINNLIAGGYGVMVTDSHGCTIKDTAIINQPSKLAISHTLTNVSCNGGNNGSINITVNGGTKPYSYKWSSGQTTEDINNLTAGGYGVMVTDSHGCVIKDTAIINQPSKLTISHTLTNVNCNSGNNGSINLTVTGGTKPYNYKWSSGQTTEDINNLIAGGYGVMVTDSHGCTIKDTAIINQPSKLTISHTLTNVSCNGGNNGSINLTVNGGTKPYSYKWSSGQTTEDINNLISGNYYVTITDSHGCIIRDTAIINQPTKLTISHVITNVSCNNGNNGSINITATGGTTPYNYKWNNGQITEDINNLVYGGYGVTVTDSHGCVIKDTALISHPTKLTFSHILTNVSCNNGSNGSINLNISGGTKPFSYKWSSGQTTEDISNLVAGGYGVTVIDSHGCVIKDTAVINQPTKLTISHFLTNVSCFNGNNGSINLTVTGGTKPYGYKWTNGQISEDIINLLAGVYGVTVTDSHGCVINDAAVINQPNILSTNYQLKNVSCFNGNNGSIDLTVTGGTKPYSYKWSCGKITEDITNLKAGLYNLVITDSMNCENKNTFSVSQPDPILISMNITNASCYNKRDGSIEVNVIGGSRPYRYNWSNGDTSSKIDKLGAGFYFLSVIDLNICNKNDSMKIDQPPPLLLVDYKIKNISCHGENDGSIDLNVTGGTPPYYYKWSNEGKTKLINNLRAGYYSVTVWDANYCIFIDSLKIVEPLPLNIQYIVKDEKCNGDKDGYINLTVTGGTKPYHYKWSNSDTTEDLNGLSAGRYSVILTDLMGCHFNLDNILISTKPLPVPRIIADERTLYCDQDSIVLSVTDPFSKYLWNTGDTGRYIVIKKAGSYFVKVTNSDQCIDKSPVINIDVQNPYKNAKLKEEYYFCPDEQKEIVLDAGTINGAKYQWMPDKDTTSEKNVDKQGIYSVNIIKGNCNIKYTAYVYEVCDPTIYIPNAFTPNGDKHNEAFFPVTRYVDTLTFIIFNRWGEILYRGYGVNDKWDGTFKNETVMQDTYCYIVYYKNRKIAWKQKSGSVNVIW